MNGHSTIFEDVEILCSQWERNSGPLPPDARHLLTKIAKRIVLRAADVCDRRAKPEDKSMTARNEATKCGMAVRHALLCKEGESVCIKCDGVGCCRCDNGVRPGWKTDEPSQMPAHDCKYVAFLKRFLNPEELGYAVPAHVRDDVREILGRERVESTPPAPSTPQA